jgi:hypothetical protein
VSFVDFVVTDFENHPIYFLNHNACHHAVCLTCSLFSGDAAMDVILFVREAFERLAPLRSEMLVKLLESLPRITSTKVWLMGRCPYQFDQLCVVQVLRATLWILGEYCLSEADLVAAYEAVKYDVMRCW